MVVVAWMTCGGGVFTAAAPAVLAALAGPGAAAFCGAAAAPAAGAAAVAGLRELALVVASSAWSPLRTALILVIALPIESTLFAVFSTVCATLAGSVRATACPNDLYHFVLTGCVVGAAAVVAGAVAGVVAGIVGFAAAIEGATTAGVGTIVVAAVAGAAVTFTRAGVCLAGAVVIFSGAGAACISEVGFVASLVGLTGAAALIDGWAVWGFAGSVVGFVGASTSFAAAVDRVAALETGIAGAAGASALAGGVLAGGVVAAFVDATTGLSLEVAAGAEVATGAGFADVLAAASSFITDAFAVEISLAVVAAGSGS